MHCQGHPLSGRRAINYTRSDQITRLWGLENIQRMLDPDTQGEGNLEIVISVFPMETANMNACTSRDGRAAPWGYGEVDK